MTIELDAEAQKRFNVKIPDAQLENIGNVQALAKCALPVRSTISAVMPSVGVCTHGHQKYCRE